MLVFDFTRRETFDNLAKWLLQLRLHATMEDPPILILGNKRDLEGQIEVTPEDLAAFKQENRGVTIFEVSARSGFNVNEAIVTLCNRMLDIKRSISGLKLK